MAVAGPIQPFQGGNGGGRGSKRGRDDDEEGDRPRENFKNFIEPLEENRSLYRPAVVLILGDSFIRRLQVHEHRLFGHYHNMGLLYDVANVEWMGIGGLTLPRLRRFYMDAVAEKNPDVIVLQIGTNDLCDRNNPAWLVAADLRHMVQLLQQNGVSHVIVCQTINRLSQGVPADIQDFPTRVYNLNTTTSSYMAGLSFATYWHHRGLWSNDRPTITRDGIHLNGYGNQLFYRSIRGAILHGIRRARSSLRRQ